MPQPSWAGQDALANFSCAAAAGGAAAPPPTTTWGGYDPSAAALGTFHPSYSYAASPAWWQAQPLAGGLGPQQLSALQAHAAQHQRLMLLQQQQSQQQQQHYQQQMQQLQQQQPLNG